MSNRKVYVATVHWHSDIWVQVQVSRLKRFISHEMRLYAYMDGVDVRLNSHFDKVFYNDDFLHYDKLDFLAERIVEEADPDDIIVFIDGDAFPIADLQPVFDRLDDYPLIAVRRDENFGDKQPHPCFCVTTVGFWQEISGTWKPGVKWMRDDGVWGSDVGGNLYGALLEANIEWLPLLRSNPVEIHPLFFGVYDNCVYHHGAGFRDKLCRRDARRGIDVYSAQRIHRINCWQGKAYMKWPRILLRKYVNWYMRRKNGRLHRQVMPVLLADEDFAFKLDLAVRQD